MIINVAMMKEVKNNITQVFDLKKMVVDALVRDKGFFIF